MYDPTAQTSFDERAATPNNVLDQSPAHGAWTAFQGTHRGAEAVPPALIVSENMEIATAAPRARMGRPRVCTSCRTPLAGREIRSGDVRARGLEPPMRQNALIASYVVNERALARARLLIRGRQYVLNSDWGDAQPQAKDENAFLASHSWSEYGEWHLGLTEGASDETKARHAFVYGDFRRLHRTGLIACQYRAAEWRHKEIELAAHDLLQLLDRSSA
jgi:hypothetical protein